MKYDIFSILSIIIITIICSFLFYEFKNKKLELIHKLYIIASVILMIWILALSFLSIFAGNLTAEYIIDSTTHVTVFLLPIMYLISLTLVKGYKKLPKYYWALFIIPMITFIMVWTNPLHHYYYKVFSINQSEIEYGWYFTVHSLYSYLMIFLALLTVIREMFVNKTKLFLYQSTFYVIGGLFPLVVSLLVTLKVINADIGILITPIANIVGFVIFHGIAILKYKMLDIMPIAMKIILDRLSDGYLVLSDDNVVVTFNKGFNSIFGKQYYIVINSVVSKERYEQSDDYYVGYYTLCSAIESSKINGSTISYEESITIEDNGEAKIKYYIVDVSPMFDGNSRIGFVILFKDITSLKNSLKKLQSSQERLVEQERLAFLGQLMGGVSHNLKTPIMSISGGTSAIDMLVNECVQSLQSDVVTADDYREIYSEIKMWTERIKEACSYMSDIIFAVRGQTINLDNGGCESFTIDEVFNRLNLLMKHELQVNKCILVIENKLSNTVKINGEINALIQIINNLISNSIDSMKPNGGKIIITIEKEVDNLAIRVIDNGCGLPESVKKSLFKQMITTKGTKGSGLGLYVSNTIVKAHFDGIIRYNENPIGGTIFSIIIPNNNVTF